MSTPETTGLLRAYVQQGSEAAFQELVARYVNLVYSTALRRVNGNPHFAEEVVQAVFTDLARKAATLPGNVLLGGWLHRHTSCLAANYLRHEHRRVAREQEAYAMNQLHDSAAADWQQVAPLLDEVIDLLEASDRDAIVLRYLEQRDLRSVGLALGVTEDTAQKRVSRAVEKLRTLLLARGATLTVAVLATALTTQAIVAAPAQLATKVGRVALKAAAGAGLLVWLANLFSSAKSKIVLAAAIALALALVLLRPPPVTVQTARIPAKPAAMRTNQPAAPILAQPAASSVLEAAPAVVENLDPNLLRLLILSAENNKPIRNVPVEVRLYTGSKRTNSTVRANRDGVCDVKLARDTTTSLELITRMDGYADTRLSWRPDRGFAIPTNYTVRLTRPVPIGGRVIDPDAQPVPDADVAFYLAIVPLRQALEESHNYLSLHTKTDADGRWHLDRIAEDVLPESGLVVTHTEFLASGRMTVNRDPKTEKELRAGALVIQLGRPVEMRGIVVDSDDKPIPGAKVRVGEMNDSNGRTGTTAEDGNFVMKGCKPGQTYLTGEAKGFAAKTMDVNLSSDSGSLRMVLERGKVLRLRVVDQAGKPVAKAKVGFWAYIDLYSPATKTPVQTQFSATSDKEGRVVWENAPDREMSFYVFADGYMNAQNRTFRPKDEEQLLTLSPALVISGTVRNADTGEPVPKFRIITGSSSSGVAREMPVFWSPDDAGWFTFANGQFRHAFQDLEGNGMPNPTLALKFEAEGFASQVSRFIRHDEGEAKLDILLKPALTTVITVLAPDGQPAAKAEVGLVTTGADLQMQAGTFSRKNPKSGKSLLTADAEGHFNLPSDDGIKLVIAMTSEGYAEGTLAALVAAPVMRLQPWGAAEGVYLAGGQPKSGRTLHFELGKKETYTLSTVYGAFQAVTDDAGRFKIDRLPPGQHKLMREVEHEALVSSSRVGTPLRSFSLVTVATVEVVSGQTTQAIIGATNLVVTFRPRLPAGATVPEGIRITANLGTCLPESVRPIANDIVALRQWWQTPAGRSWSFGRRPYVFQRTSDGNYSAEGVSPGIYDLDISASSQSGGKYLDLARTRITVTVPAKPAGGTLDLGEVPLAQSTRQQ